MTGKKKESERGGETQSTYLSIQRHSEPLEANLSFCFLFFFISWMSCHCSLGAILVGNPLLGRFTTVPNFVHLWQWFARIPKLWKWLCNLFQTDRQTSVTLFLICSWFVVVVEVVLWLEGFILRSCSCFHFVQQVLFKGFLESTKREVIVLGCGQQRCHGYTLRKQFKLLATWF